MPDSLISNNSLYAAVSSVLQQARQTAYRAVNFTMVTAYWEIGRLITEDELKWERAEYGKQVLKNLAERLTNKFGKGFDERELRKMRQFYQSFQIRDTLRPELTKQSDDNPTIGLILCSEKNEAVVKYSVLNDAKQIFASKYKLTLPSEEELKLEIEKERKKLEN